MEPEYCSEEAILQITRLNINYFVFLSSERQKNYAVLYPEGFWSLQTRWAILIRILTNSSGLHV